jgi:hypothetical protein
VWQFALMLEATGAAWALEEFGRAQLGDARRTARVVTMATQLAERPAGKVTEAFPTSAGRQGAYNILESERIVAEQLVDAAGRACARRAADAHHPFVYVPVDGTSATLTDTHGAKHFGGIGSYSAGARGLKVLSAIAVEPDGTPLGVCAQDTWMRAPQRPKRRRRPVMRRIHEKETQHWIDVVRATATRFEQEAPGTRCWFQFDREADAWPILQALVELPSHDFTVRAAWNRRVRRAHGMGKLREVVAGEPVLGVSLVNVTGRPKRRARQAHVSVRFARVVLDLRDARTKRHWPLELNVVWAHEVHTTPHGEQPLDWLLLTNRTVDSLGDAQRVIDGYALRWRLEDVHKTWKSSACHIEDSQLHTRSAVSKWASLLFVVAIRIERLKHLARGHPELPATVELSDYEIHALLLLKRKEKKRTETIPNTVPTMVQAVRWIADLGGYTGKSSGGPPGSITLRRGLDRVTAGAEALEAFDEERGQAG